MTTKDDAYYMIDRFLRNNLGDDDYAEYSASLDALAAPESGAMAEIDYTDDDALRFIQRVLESNAPEADIRDARNMVVGIRTRVLKARADRPAPEPTTDVAVKRLSKALRDDLDYAWSWHCNVAMTAYDAGCPHDVANEGAARFMQVLAGVDTRKHPGFARTQTNPMDSPDARHAQELLAQDITLQNMRERHAQELCAYQITVDKLKARRKPMDREEMMDGYCRTPQFNQFVQAFEAGVLYAEYFHGIGEKP